MQSPQTEDRLMFAFAHDLRASLRTINTRLQMIQVRDTLPKDGPERGYIEEASRAATEMNNLISAMTAYFDAGRVSERTGLGLLLKGLVAESKTTTPGASLAISNEIDTTVPSALQAVLRELVTNAHRFRNPDKALEIRISVTLDAPGMLAITVADNGQGLDAASVEKLFQPFARMHPRRDYPGFGLGLARCRRAVEVHGGSIAATLQAQGGLAITVRTPIS